MVEITLVRLIEGVQPEEAVLKVLSEEKREQVKRFRKLQDKKRSILAELLIRQTASKKLEIPVPDIRIYRNTYGKPFVPNDKGYHMNLTHSGSFVAITVSNQPVGIDIEEMKPADMQIAHRFFAKKEIEYILSAVSQEQQTEKFYRIWTLKECYIKALGYGLRVPLNSFEFRIGNPIQVTGSYSGESFHFFNSKMEDYITSICYQEEHLNKEFQHITELQVYDAIRRLS